jgi:2-hydroxychromene-2-carboxylate isomerase
LSHEDVSSPVTAAFYFDLASPEAYLAAERILHVLGGRAPVPAEWRPVLARELPGADSSQAHSAEERSALELRAHDAGLQPLRWPTPFPFDSSLAMRVASYARSIGRTVPFAQAAFRQAFAGGHSLENPDFVLIAAAACEMHPRAVLKGVQLRSTAAALERACARAAAADVTELPAIATGSGIYCGERALELATDALAL